VDCGAAPVYQFSAASHGGAFHVLRDFSPANAFTWTAMQEGSYDIKVTVKDGYQAAETTIAVAAAAVASRVSGSQAVVTPTANPLVALYSVPPSPAGTVFVQFAVAGDHPAWRNTDTRAVVPGKSTNFFVAGMLPGTTYEMRAVFNDGTGSAPLFFTAGSLPSTLAIPAFTVVQPTDLGSDADQDMIFHQLIRGNQPLLATNLAGQVTWYYDLSGSGFTLAKAGQSLLPGGTLLLNGVDRYTPVPTAPDVLREIDLAGNPVRETNLAAVNAQLAALGHEPVHAFHHDVQRLADGTTVALAYTERTIDVNGTPTNYVGDMVIVLDSDFQVKWAWDAFDHLDVRRGPVLGEVVSAGSPEPTAVVPRLPAVDWLHVNAVSLSPADGNLIVSLRHQDWVIKIDYRNGAGDGHVIWRLGQGGDFTLNSVDPTGVVFPPARPPLHRRPHADPLRQRQHPAGDRPRRPQPWPGLDARRDEHDGDSDPQRGPGGLLVPAGQRAAAVERELLVPLRQRRPGPPRHGPIDRGPPGRGPGLRPRDVVAGVPRLPGADALRGDRRRAGRGAAEGRERSPQRRLGATVDG
jgi:hypothetical protein